MVLRSCGLAVLRSCDLAVLRSCDLAVLRSCGLAVFQSVKLVIKFHCPTTLLPTASCLSNILNEQIKQKISIRRTPGGLGMELGGEEGLRAMLHPLVGVIVHIDKQRYPACRQSVVVHSKTVIL